ncbi:MAG: hypothetical protein L6R40_000932 [Gallowayella cf. fulva]|nr:MAG: hypothetical protein L6R40_000932 [Xanthomendoza cf. fulva]
MADCDVGLSRPFTCQPSHACTSLRPSDPFMRGHILPAVLLISFPDGLHEANGIGDMSDASDEPNDGFMSTSSKAVIIEEPESISPNSSPALDAHHQPNLPTSPRKHRASLGSRKLSGRPAPNPSNASLHSLASIGSAADITSSHLLSKSEGQSSRPKHHPHANQVLSQVRDWLHHEKARSSKRKSKAHHGHEKHTAATGLVKSLVDHVHSDSHRHGPTHHRRQSSDLSEDNSLALEQLEKILSTNLQLEEDNEILSDTRKPSMTTRKYSIRRSLRKKSTGISSDTDYQDGDLLVPSADVILDNSKTLSYTGGAASSESDLAGAGKKSKKEKDAWVQFKNEIVRLTHTLKCKGWRRVPLEGAHIDVERLSGALTNAVYVVSPPKDLSQLLSRVSLTGSRKLLLRIYGPQVEHLIDRENELQILRRLARKKIGPRLLGTFTNGRFEEFFNARTLTAMDLRIPETSKQIAKRMRELHDGIELLEEERDAGPFMWRNWDSWVGRCEDVITWLDEKMAAGNQGPAKSGADAWKQRGLVCGVEWSVFRKTVERYRKWLEEQYGGYEAVKDKLVFAHNDTQYGNLLRLQPSGESPLLHPANEHKQLIVIDFEYASANVPGQEFANHFTEWCYNYHNAQKPYALNERSYPTVEEQHRFLKAYVQHRPFRPSLSTQSSSASLRPTLSHSISNFMLDSRAPPAQIAEEEKKREEATENEIQRLAHEARIWRPANSAQWVAWGIVQAKVEGMDEALEAKKKKSSSDNADYVSSSAEDREKTESESTASGPVDPLSQETGDVKNQRPEEETGGATGDGDAGGEGGDEFDYLGYAQERAMFFWGDVLQMGLIAKEELPEEVRKRVKVVEY